MFNFCPAPKVTDSEDETEKENLQREHQLLNDIMILNPECTGAILRMRWIEKKLLANQV